MKPLTLTVDFEDPTESYKPDGRYVALTERLLDLCDETGRKATFFTIGRLADSAPDLIRRIAQRGHEIAYHSRAHLSLTEETPERFAREVAQDKDRLQQLAGHDVTGFRAPRFSLTPVTLWATEILAEAGFTYSSSIMPTSVSRFGFPDASGAPFYWPSGLLELPLPVASIGPLKVPYAGGIYLYALPSFITRACLDRAGTDDVLWTYCHPYDLDRSESYIPMPHTPLWVSLILWAARTQAEKKLRRLLATTAPAPTLGALAQSLKV